MKIFIRTFLFIPSLILLFSTMVHAQGIEFATGAWTDVVARAKAEKKMIFVDFYAEWCGPCKFMSKNVFTDASVANYYKQNFISYKVDAEKEEPELVALAGINAYPSLYYYDSNGKEVTRHIGALDVEGFTKMGAKALKVQEMAGNMEQYRSTWEADKNNSEKLFAYLEALVMTDRKEEGRPLAAAYLSKIKETDLINEDNWMTIQLFALPDSREHNYVMKHAEAFLEAYGKTFIDYVMQQVNSRLAQGVETKNTELISKAKDDYFGIVSVAATDEKLPRDFYDASIDLYYLKATGDSEGYFTRLANWMNTYNSGNKDELLRRILEVCESYDDKAKIAEAVKWAGKLIAIEDDVLANYAMAVAQKTAGNTAEARKYIQRASEMNDNQELQEYIDALKAQID